MTTAQQMIAKARTHLGENGTKTWSWYNSHVAYSGTGWSWCAAFLSRVATECGLKHVNTASAAAFGNQFTRVADAKVKAGDIVTFNWDGRTDTGWMDHVALVTSFNHSTNVFHTIDGNSGDDNWTSTVRENTYDNNASYFTAFWRPNYSTSKVLIVDAATYGPVWSGMQSGSMGTGVAGKYGKNVEINPVSFENFSGTEDFFVSVLVIFINTEAVCLEIAVKAQPDKKIVFFEKLRPFVIDERSVCLQTEENG